ncbi:MAG: hypothetical protein ACBR12_15150 [Microcoleus sp.]
MAFTSILTDSIGAIEWEGSRPSQQIPNSAMIVRVAIARRVHQERSPFAANTKHCDNCTESDRL